MPGPISETSKGPSGDTPYVPSWCYDNGARQCVCGDHEGYHDDEGKCLRVGKCGCKGFQEASQ